MDMVVFLEISKAFDEFLSWVSPPFFVISILWFFYVFLYRLCIQGPFYTKLYLKNDKFFRLINDMSSRPIEKRMFGELKYMENHLDGVNAKLKIKILHVHKKSKNLANAWFGILIIWILTVILGALVVN